MSVLISLRADLWQLPFRNAVPVEDDPGGLEAGGLVELDEELAHHVGEIFDDLLPWPLHPNRGTVSTGMCVHTAHYLHTEREKDI